jgi:Flp pilus assembly protein TadD
MSAKTAGVSWFDRPAAMMTCDMKSSLVICLIAASLVSGCASDSHRVVATAPPGPDTALARAENDCAYALIEQHKDKEAEAHLHKAIEADVTFGPAHNNLGLIYYRQGRYYDAAWEFYNTTKLMPYQPDVRNNLGMVLEMDVTKYNEAIDSYEQARKLAPDNPEYLANLARAKDRRGDRDEEMKKLLQELAFKDSRADWRDWARMKLFEIAPRPSDAGPTTLPSTLR